MGNASCCQTREGGEVTSPPQGAASEGEVNRPGAGAELGNPQPAGLNSPQDGATTLAANEPRHESPSKQMVQDPSSRLQIPDAAAAAIAAAGWDSSAADHSNSRQQPGQLPSLKVSAPREASPAPFHGGRAVHSPRGEQKGKEFRDRFKTRYLEARIHFDGTAGFGVNVTNADCVIVNKVMDGSLAHQAGLEDGDQIVEMTVHANSETMNYVKSDAIIQQIKLCAPNKASVTMKYAKKVESEKMKRISSNAGQAKDRPQSSAL